ncbi:unnamed protein product, partial [Closterium sp. Naga37s-1]
MGASLASLTRTNVRQFISHGFFHRFYNELSSEYQEAVEELVDRAEAGLGMHFKDPDAPAPPPPDLLSFRSDSEGESDVGEERGESESGDGDESGESESESEAAARPMRTAVDAVLGGSAVCGPLEAAAIAASSRSLGRNWSDAQLPRTSGSSADCGKGEGEEAGSGSEGERKGEDDAGFESSGGGKEGNGGKAERRKKEKGVDESVRFMAHTREPLRAIIHPLAFYVWCAPPLLQCIAPSPHLAPPSLSRLLPFTLRSLSTPTSPFHSPPPSTLPLPPSPPHRAPPASPCCPPLTSLPHSP